jgi:dephospho-CoA kinase
VGSSPLTVGLTGGVGSGKSTVARLLAVRGAACCDADELVAEMYAGGPAVDAVRALFGASVIAADGSVDRRALGEVVLADTSARRRLEAAIHPLVRAEIRAWRDGMARAAQSPDVAVVEAALLVESGTWSDYDRLVVVAAPLPLRRERALAGGWRRETFDRVADAQADDKARAAVADYLVDNVGDQAELERAVAGLWQHLVGDAIARREGRVLPHRRD